MASKHIAVWPRVRVFPLGGDPVVVNRGDLLPKGIAAAELENLVSFGAIAGVTGLPDTVADVELGKATAPPAPGTEAYVLAEVGEDKALAEVALAEEQSKEKPRKGLVAKLETIVAAGTGS